MYFKKLFLIVATFFIKPSQTSSKYLNLKLRPDYTFCFVRFCTSIFAYHTNTVHFHPCYKNRCTWLGKGSLQSPTFQSNALMTGGLSSPPVGSPCTNCTQLLQNRHNKSTCTLSPILAASN